MNEKYFVNALQHGGDDVTFNRRIVIPVGTPATKPTQEINPLKYMKEQSTNHLQVGAHQSIPRL
jgi:hypothetical protein